MLPLRFPLLAITGIACFHPLLSVFGAEQQSGSTPEAISTQVEPVTDFSAELNHLATLGMPDLKDARWVGGVEGLRSQLQKERVRDMRFSNLEMLELLGMQISKHGWLLKVDGQLRILQIGWIQTVPARHMKYSSSGIFLNMLGSRSSPKDTVSEEDFPVADLAADVEGLIISLGKAAADLNKKEDESEVYSKKRMSSYYRSRQCRINGRMVIFAAQINQHGEADLANKLVSAIFKHFPEREEIIASAVNSMAEDQYLEKTRELFVRGDWATYEKKLNELIEKFPHDWNDRGAASILLELVKKRNEAGVAKVEAPAGQILDATAVASLEAMCAPGKTPKETGLFDINYRMNENAETIWIIAPPRKSAGAEEIVTLRMLGMKALPALIAVADDKSLTRLLNDVNGPPSLMRRGFENDKDKKCFLELYRPLVRGEIASSLLREVLPAGTRNYDWRSKKSLGERAMAFYEKNRTKSAEELARIYLQDGDLDQQARALNYFLFSDRPEDWQIFETEGLQYQHPSWIIDSVRNYAEKRGAEVKDFCLKFTTLVRQERTDISLEVPEGARSLMDDHYEKRLCEIEALVGAKK